MSNARLVLWFTAVLVISLVSRWRIFDADAERCALDGQRIVPIYRVDLMDGNERRARFCSIGCASDWPATSQESVWHVRDEVTGKTLDATKACFVLSDIVTIPARQERRHIFSSWADAHAHLAEFNGERISNPFAKATEEP